LGHFCRRILLRSFWRRVPGVAASFHCIENCAEERRRTGEFQNPGFLHLRIANDAQAAEKLAAGFAEIAPGGVRVHFFKDRSERTATAQRDAEIMNGIFVGDERTRARSLSARSISTKALQTLRFSPKGMTAAITTSTCPFRSLRAAPLWNGGGKR